MTMAEYVLETRHLGIRFGGLKAVDDVNIQIKKNQIYGLIGPNGAGKTTVFNLVTGVYAPTEGEIYLDGQWIGGLSQEKINHMGIARTFQNIRLFNNMSVIQNVMVGLHHDPDFNSGFLSTIFRLPKHFQVEKGMRARALKLLELFDLQGEQNEKAFNLPYGKQRKLEIARALATDPKLLLLDEPAAGMNPQETMELAAFIREIRDKFQKTVLLIEHHMDLVMDIADRIYVIDFGKLIASGTPEEIQNNQRVIDAYLGVEEDA